MYSQNNRGDQRQLGKKKLKGKLSLGRTCLILTIVWYILPMLYVCVCVAKIYSLHMLQFYINDKKNVHGTIPISYPHEDFTICVQIFYCMQ